MGRGIRRAVLGVVAAAVGTLPAHADAFSTDCYETGTGWFDRSPSSETRVCTGRLISVLSGNTIILEYKHPQGQTQISRVRLIGGVPCVDKCPRCDKAINNSKATVETLRSLIGEPASFTWARFKFDSAGRSEIEAAMVLDRSGHPAIDTLFRLGLYCPGQFPKKE